MCANALKLSCVLSLLMLAACQTQGTFTQADLDAAEAEVQAELDEFWAAWSASDFDEGMAFYSDEPEMTFVTDGTLWESKAVVEETYRSFFESLERQDINVSETRILPVTPEIVYVTQAATYTTVSQSGEISPQRSWAGSLLWVKRAGEWTVMGYNASEPNPSPANMLSIHLLNTPSAADEAAYAEGLRGLNAAIRAAGYLGNGYELWKIGPIQESEYEPVEAGLILEGAWTDQETYDLIHALDAYESIDEQTMEMFQRVAAGQRYTRYVRVPVGGPGEG